MWTRRGILVAGGATLAAGCGGADDDERAKRARTAADAEIVRSLLRCERLGLALWDEVVRTGAVRDRRAAALARTIARNEREHVDVLERYERRLAPDIATDMTPAGDVAAIVARGERAALRAGTALAQLTASAYAGQLNRVQDRTLLASVLAIHTVEARHAAALADAEGRTDALFPDGAFAEPATMARTEARLRRLAA